jgi:GWxTD domain-containing protein
MNARLLLVIGVLVLVAPALLAGGLGAKYQSWPNSPQGYFMTASERAEWKATVKTDADAEAFIKKFLARRDAGFAADVAARAEMADKHMTVSGRPGSLTTRGKIVILLGPPSSFSINKRQTRGSASGTSDYYNQMDPSTGPNVGDMSNAAVRRDMSGELLNDYVFTYTADKLPGKAAKDFMVVVEVRAGDGTDRIADRKAMAQLDEIFEAAAQSRVVAAAAPAPKP